jgi:hypothetical protein
MLRALALCVLLPLQARADLVTEFGGGYVLPGTSFVNRPECWMVTPMRAPGVPAHSPYELDSCGGHDPVFVGWPIAWEFQGGTKIGVFHMSHWFDGKPFKGDGEASFTCLCATWTHHWRAR